MKTHMQNNQVGLIEALLTIAALIVMIAITIRMF
jgi:hypothetical protein